jgi:hypothetical protein
MICIKQIWKYMACALTLILSVPLWGKSELPVLPATIAVQGLSLNINPQASVYDENTGFSGTGTIFFPALGRELPVTYTNVRLDNRSLWQSGSIKARIAPDLLKAAAIDDVEHPKFVGNFDRLKNFIKTARSHTNELPLMLNAVPSYENANFGTLAVMLTEINVSDEGATASMMALERMPEGIYLPFTRTGIAFDPLSMQPFKTTELALTATAEVADVQLPITFLAGDATGSKGTYVSFDCNGIKAFRIEGFHKFTSGIVTPSPASAPPVVASFVAEVKSLRQFVVKVTIPKFTVFGIEDVAFEILDAEIDYSDSENPLTLPEAYFKEMGNTAPTKRETWKGIYIGNVGISLPTLPMRDKDGNPFAFGSKDMIYDKGNGFSATVYAKLGGFADINIKGFRLTLDEFNFRLKKSSVQNLNFLGGLAIPVLLDEKGALQYKATFNTSKEANQPKFQVGVEFPKDIELQVPLLELAGCKLQKTSVVQISNKNDKWNVFANLQGAFTIGTKAPKLFLGLPFEGWKIGDDPSVATQSGAEELPMNFKAFDLDGSSNSAPPKKMSGFPLTVDGIRFNSEKGGYKFTIDVGVAIGSGTSSFQAKGGIVISAGLQFSKLISKKPWEGIEFKDISMDKLAVNADMSAFIFRGELLFLNNHPIFGNGFQAKNMMLKVKAGKGFELTTEAVFGNKDNYSYFYIDGNLAFGNPVPLAGPLYLHGAGGGVYFNMKQQLSGDGKTYSYVPQKDTKGLNLRVNVGLTKRETFDAVGEMQFEFGAEWELRFFKIVVKAGLLNDISTVQIAASTPYYASKVAGNFTFMFDNVNKNITANAYVQLQNIPIDGKAELNMFFDLEDGSNWFVRFGTPKTPAYVSWGPVRVGMYLMLGKGVGDLPNMGEIVPELVSMDLVRARRDDFNRTTSLNSTGSGFAFGISYKLEQEFSFLMFSGGVKAAFGVDVALRNDLVCKDGRKIGWNGWNLQGQAYAYLGARVDIDVDLWFVSGRFNIATLQVGAVLEAQLPEPLKLSGRVAARYSILGGLVKGKFNIKFEIIKDGTPCEVETFPTSPAVGVPIVSATYPESQGEMQVFDDIIVSTNLAIRNTQTYEFVNKDGNTSRHFYKVRLTQVDIVQGTKTLATMANSDIVYKDDYTFVLTPRVALPSKTSLKLVISAKAYDTQENGNIIKEIGKGESRTVEFKTGERPEKVYTPMIGYSAPGTDQKYWYKGYAKPQVILKQEGYGYLFDPNPNGVPSEYKWRLYKKEGADSVLVGTYDLNSDLSTIDTVRVGNKITFQQSRSFSFLKLNELNLDKKATYRMEVVRQPKDIKKVTSVTDASTKTAAGSDADNEAIMQTRQLSVTKGNLQEIAILYSNEFSISQFDDVAEKIAIDVKSVSTETPNSLGQPHANSTDNLDGQLMRVGYRPFITMAGTVQEPLDKYDIQRIVLNSSVIESVGSEFNNKIYNTQSELIGNKAVEHRIMTEFAHRYGSGTDSYHNDKVMNSSFNNFVRAGDRGVELVFNSVNVLWARSELMNYSAQNIRLASARQEERGTGRYKKKFTGSGRGSDFQKIEIMETVTVYDNSTFISHWWGSYSSYRYQPGSYKINATLSYTAPNTIPERFDQKLPSGTVKTYKFSFTPPSR